MDQSARARRFLQCAWLSADRHRLVVPVENVVGLVTTRVISRSSVFRALSQFDVSVARMWGEHFCSVFLFTLCLHFSHGRMYIHFQCGAVSVLIFRSR